MRRTISEFLYEYLSEFELEYAEKCVAHDWNACVSSFAKALELGFIWSKMPQGKAYWQDKHRKLCLKNILTRNNSPFISKQSNSSDPVMTIHFMLEQHLPDSLLKFVKNAHYLNWHNYNTSSLAVAINLGIAETSTVEGEEFWTHMKCYARKNECLKKLPVNTSNKNSVHSVLKECLSQVQFNNAINNKTVTWNNIVKTPAQALCYFNWSKMPEGYDYWKKQYSFVLKNGYLNKSIYNTNKTEQPKFILLIIKQDPNFLKDFEERIKLSESVSSFDNTTLLAMNLNPKRFIENAKILMALYIKYNLINSAKHLSELVLGEL